MIVPEDFFVFQFQVFLSRKKPKKEIEGRVRELIFKEDYLDKAIVKLKKGIKEIKEINENYFKDFKVFYDNIMRLLRTELNGGWLSRGYVSIANFKVT